MASRFLRFLLFVPFVLFVMFVPAEASTLTVTLNDLMSSPMPRTSAHWRRNDSTNARDSSVWEVSTPVALSALPALIPSTLKAKSGASANSIGPFGVSSFPLSLSFSAPFFPFSTLVSFSEDRS